MKSYLLTGVLLVAAMPALFGEIKNGYEKDIPKLMVSLENIQDLLSAPNLSLKERKKLKARIKLLKDLRVYSELTAKLLAQFREIAPDLYDQINDLRDKKGRIIDVYVKFIPEEGAPLDSHGIVSFIRSEEDEDRCSSEYGEGSVSVIVWILNNSLVVLAHEFGHLKYMGPNLASYVKYYNKVYTSSRSRQVLGHRLDDPSGENALQFQKRFRVSLGRYIKGDHAPVSTYAIMNQTRRELLRRDDEKAMSFVANGW